VVTPWRPLDGNNKIFLRAISDTLALPIEYVRIDSIVSGFGEASSRRLSPQEQSDLGFGDSSGEKVDDWVRIKVTIMGTKQSLNYDVLPMLREPLFESVLLTELKTHQIAASLLHVEGEHTSMPQLTTHAMLQSVLSVTVVIAIVTAFVAFIGISLKAYKENGGRFKIAALSDNDNGYTHIKDAEKFTAEETQGLTKDETTI